MGPRLGVVLAVGALMLAGCSGESESVPDDPGAPPSEDNAAESEILRAPSLETGMSWTYRTGGFWDQVPEITIALAEATAEGYLFAAAEREQLADEIAWDLPYLGWADRALRAQRDAHYRTGLHGAQLLAFPLEPGKTWNYYETALLANPAEIQVMGRTVPGYSILGEDETRRVLVEYAPSVGYVTRYEDFSKSQDSVAWSLELVRTSNATSWHWFERGAEVFAGGLVDASQPPVPAAPAELSVTADDDSVFAWFLSSSSGARAVVQPPPPTEAWIVDLAGPTSPKTAWFEPQQGEWRLTGTPSGPDEWVYIQGHAVRWVTS